MIRAFADYYIQKECEDDYKFVIFNLIIPYLYDFAPLLIMFIMHFKSYRAYTKENKALFDRTFESREASKYSKNDRSDRYSLNS